MLDPSKKYKHLKTGEDIEPHVISSLYVIETYLASGYKSEDYSIWEYADIALNKMEARTLPEALEYCIEK